MPDALPHATIGHHLIALTGWFRKEGVDVE